MKKALNNIGANVHTKLEELFQAKKGLNVWQWAEENISLSSRITPRPGPYRTEWCPYVRAPQEDFTDPNVRDIVLCWASRSTKTETLLNCIRYSIAEDPQAIQIVMPSTLMARSFSETRLQPSIDDCPILTAEKPSNADKFRLLEMHFKRCSLFITGSNSPANLKGRGVTILLCDEIDTWKKATKKETGALQQVLERTKDRWNRKHLISSTPTLEDGQIWIEFLLGDQRYYYVPCPHCGESQTLKLKQVKWDESARGPDGQWDLKHVRLNTWYECEKCSGKITDSNKGEMLRKGEWRATAKGKEPGRRSYHLSSLYPEWIPFGEVAVMFLQSKNSVEELQRFVNSWLAEPFYEYGDSKEMEERLEKKKTDVQVVGVPQDYRVLITADLQINHLYFVVRAWNERKDSILMDYGMIPGFEELLLVATKWNAVAGFIDSAYRPQIVLEWCSNNPGWIPSLGSPVLYTPMRWSKIPIDGGLNKGKEVMTLRFRSIDWRETLNDRMTDSEGKHPKWTIPSNVSEDYKKQMAGERRHEKKGPRGSRMIEWTKVGPNHYFDCEVIQTVGFEAIRPMMFEVPLNDSTPPAMKSQADIEAEAMRQTPRAHDDIWAGARDRFNG